jgi:hypothetical protein
VLNLAGVDLVVPKVDNDAIEFLERYIPRSSYRPWLRPSRPPPQSAGLTFPWTPDEPPFKLNRLWWPTGASRWGYMHCLASSDQVAQVMNNAYSTGASGDGSYFVLSLLMGTPDIGPQVGMPGSTDNQVDIQMFLMPPTPLSGIRGLSQMTTGTQSLYLLTLVDQRWWWYQKTGTVEVDPTTTWDNLYATLAGLIGLDPNNTFNWDTIPSQYLQPSPVMFTLDYQPITFLLDAVAFNIGQRIVCNFDGTVNARNASTDYVNLTSDFANRPTRLIMAGGPRFSPADFPFLSGSPTALFPQNTLIGDMGIGAVNVNYGQACGPTSYLSTYNLNAGVGTEGSTLMTIAFTDLALPCRPSGGGDPTNKAALDALTQQFAGDFILWFNIQFDITLIGIVNVQPNGYIDTIELEYSGDTALTRIYSFPWNGWSINLGHEDPNCPSSPSGGVLTLGISTTDIPSGGSGSVQLYAPDGVTTTGQPVQVSNSGGWWSTDIPTGTHVIVGRVGCTLRIVSASC